MKYAGNWQGGQILSPFGTPESPAERMDELDELLALAESISTQLEHQEAVTKAKAKAKRKQGKPRPNQKRNRGEDTPLTIKLVYKIMDRTDKTVYFCEGLGATEQMVDKLLADGHKLVKFTTNNNGDKLVKPSYHQCVLSNNGNFGYRAFWRPGAEYDKAVVVKGETSDMGLFETKRWPNFPGGLYYELNRMPKPKVNRDEEPVRTGMMGIFAEEERSHLDELAKKGEFVVSGVTSDEDLLGALELVLNAHFSEAAMKQALHLLKRGTTAWPLTVEQAIESSTAREIPKTQVEKLQAENEALKAEVTRLKAANQAHREFMDRALAPDGKWWIDRTKMRNLQFRRKQEVKKIIEEFDDCVLDW